MFSHRRSWRRRVGDPKKNEKVDRDPSLVGSYKPISLIPCLDKILGNLFLLKFQRWFSINDVIDPNQYSFRENRCCELPVSKTVTKIQSLTNDLHAAFVSVDLKAAFDNMNWSILFGLFDKNHAPFAYRNFIYFYLINRCVVSNDYNLFVKNEIFKGCPQGSLLAPLLWNLYFNHVLQLNNDLYYLQAFADDLELVTLGRNREIVELDTNNPLDLIFRK
ncbi:hypothetical protein AVEN_89214-1 [Araneus ventricosus]|uniref:Reverse transcriptase domain-containing protein n=1 Tax=Araneus ventricosus TaxID=182803 RepID=A0A4Y2RMP8_ARAVE|nr:hypothetical protein AVEN_89214-1 [Araneus ventricosus]